MTEAGGSVSGHLLKDCGPWSWPSGGGETWSTLYRKSGQGQRCAGCQGTGARNTAQVLEACSPWHGLGRFFKHSEKVK